MLAPKKKEITTLNFLIKYNLSKLVKKNSILIVALISFFIGCIIYIMMRGTNLLMFSWFEDIGIYSFLMKLRNAFVVPMNLLPKWFLYSLPLALWYFSGLLIISLIWGRLFHQKIFWSLFFSIIAFGSEYGQLIGIVPGTFDKVDIYLMLLVTLTTTLINRKQIKKELMNEKI